jgi:hypothetical protein
MSRSGCCSFSAPLSGRVKGENNENRNGDVVEETPEGRHPFDKHKVIYCGKIKQKEHCKKPQHPYHDEGNIATFCKTPYTQYQT